MQEGWWELEVVSPVPLLSPFIFNLHSTDCFYSGFYFNFFNVCKTTGLVDIQYHDNGPSLTLSMCKLGPAVTSSSSPAECFHTWGQKLETLICLGNYFRQCEVLIEAFIRSPAASRRRERNIISKHDLLTPALDQISCYVFYVLLWCRGQETPAVRLSLTKRSSLYEPRDVHSSPVKCVQWIWKTQALCFTNRTWSISTYLSLN